MRTLSRSSGGISPTCPSLTSGSSRRSPRSSRRSGRPATPSSGSTRPRARSRPSTARRSFRGAMRRKRILVTGGAGFVGSHLCDRLVASGSDVVCLDNLFTGSRENTDHLPDSHPFEFVRHDVCEPITVEVDEIYHLACPASPIHY